MKTEKNENWNPGHSLNKGYPYSEIVSREIMPQRLALDMFMNDEKDPRVFLREEPSLTDFPTYPGFPEKQTKLEQFLLDRSYDYHMALEAAEGQITVLLDEKPFIPEAFGFYTAIKNKLVTEVPVHIYVSKFQEDVAMYRKPLEDPNDFRGSTLTTWVLTKRQNGNLINIDLNLPCERIAYATLSALGIKMEHEEGAGVIEVPVDKKKNSAMSEYDYSKNFNHKVVAEGEDNKLYCVIMKESVGRDGDRSVESIKKEYFNNTPEKKTSHRVLFERQKETSAEKNFLYLSHADINATNDKEAIAKAKFIIETTETKFEFSNDDIKFEELSVV